MPVELTNRQSQIIDFIASSIEERGFPPTLREIGENFGIKSTNGVNDHLKALERKGLAVFVSTKTINCVHFESYWSELI